MCILSTRRLGNARLTNAELEALGVYIRSHWRHACAQHTANGKHALETNKRAGAHSIPSGNATGSGTKVPLASRDTAQQSSVRATQSAMHTPASNTSGDKKDRRRKQAHRIKCMFSNIEMRCGGHADTRDSGAEQHRRARLESAIIDRMTWFDLTDVDILRSMNIQQITHRNGKA